MIFPSAEKNFKKNSWNFRGFLFKIGFFVQTLINDFFMMILLRELKNLTLSSALRANYRQAIAYASSGKPEADKHCGRLSKPYYFLYINRNALFVHGKIHQSLSGE